ncbi:unnamed protein product [Lota lota]
MKCKLIGRLGDKPDPRPSIRTPSSEAEAAVNSTPASTMPWRVVVSGSSLRAVLAMLLIQLSKLLTSVSPGSSFHGKFSTIFQESQRLLRSCLPWARVTVDRQQARASAAHRSLPDFCLVE